MLIYGIALLLLIRYPPAGPDGDGVMAPLLQIEGLTRRFGGVTAVNALSLAVDEGELVSIIGPNGAGKTTVFNLVTGLNYAGRRHRDLRGTRHHRASGREACAARLRAHVPARPRVREPRVCSTMCWSARTRGSRRCGRTWPLIGPVAELALALVRPASVKAEEEELRADAMEILALFGERLRAAHRQSGLLALLCEPPPPRDRARARARTARAVPRRADRRHESDRDRGDARDHPHAERPVHHPADRAQARSGDAALRPRRGDGRRRQDRRRPAARGRRRSRRDRRLSRLARGRSHARVPAQRARHGRHPQARSHQLVLRADPGPLRLLDRSPARADRLPARRQCQRQVDHHEGDPRAVEAALRRRDPRRRNDHRPADAADHPARAWLGAGGAAPVRRHDGARECPDGRLHPQRQGRDRAGLRAHDDAVPAPGRTRHASRRHALGRRAADGRDGARADGAARA